MATKAQNLKGLFTEVKTRTIIIFTMALLMIGVIVGIFGISKKPQPVPGGPSTTANLPSISARPGIVEAPSIQYAQALQQANERAAEVAKATGASAIPTVVASAGSLSGADTTTPSIQPQLNLPPTLPTTPGAGADNIIASKMAYTKQLGDLFAAWTKPANQAYVQSMFVDKEAAAPKGTAAKKASSPNYSSTNNNNKYLAAEETLENAPLQRAGDIVFAILDTSINTDEENPKGSILATIVSGPLAGGKLLGDMKLVDKRVTISFSKLSMPDGNGVMSINAVAIDPNTARTALATSVDSHYLVKYGTIFASAFIQGYAQAVSRQGQTTTTSPFGGTTTTYDNSQISAKDKVIMAFGQVGTQVGSQFSAAAAAIQPTVKVAAGVNIGVLFLDDLKVSA